MEIPVKIVFRGMKARPQVEAYVRERAARLDAVYDRIQRCDVVVELPHHSHRRGNQVRVRIELSVPGGRLAVSRDPGPDETHEDVHVAVRDSFDAARRRLEDHVRRRLRGEGRAPARLA